MEVLEARGTFETLSERLNNSDVKKADKENVESTRSDLQRQINSLASGSPKGSYATVSALISANPETGVYIIQQDGHIYSWTKNAENTIDLGVYQATSIKKDSINISCLSTQLKEYTNNFLDVENSQHGYTISTSETSTIDTSGTLKEGFILYPVIPVRPNERYMALDSDGNGVTINAIAFYNNEGKFINYMEISKNNEVIINEGVYYVRFASADTIDITQFKRTDVDNYTTEYEPFREKLLLTYDKDFQEVKNNVDRLVTIKTNFINNSYINKQGEAVSDDYSTPYSSSDFVEVVENYKLTLKNVCTNGNCSIAGFDVNKKFISLILNKGIDGNIADSVEITIPKDIKYIKFTVITSNIKINKIYYSDDNLLRNISIPKLDYLLNNIGIKVNDFLNKTAKTPLITWIDDDCNYEGIANVKNICDNLGIKCTFACVTSGISTSNEDISNAGLNNTDLKNRLLDYQSQGFHITTHSNHHAKIWQQTDDNYNPAECEKDLITSLNMLKANGFLDYDFLIAPFRHS